MPHLVKQRLIETVIVPKKCVSASHAGVTYQGISIAFALDMLYDLQMSRERLGLLQ